MSIEELYVLGQNFIFELEQKEKKSEPEVNQCHHDYVIMNGFDTCIYCNETDLDSNIYVEEYSYGEPTQRNRSVYKRKHYFTEKLRLISCLKVSYKFNYNTVLEQLRTEKFDNIFELRSIMKEKKLHKFYSYIFIIYKDLKKKKLIKLTNMDLKLLTSQFLDIEQRYKNDKDYRKYISGYNTIIYFLLKHNGFSGYEFILLPTNIKKIEHIIDQYFRK